MSYTPEYTKNKLILWYAAVRLRGGEWIAEHFPRRWRDAPVLKHVFSWAYSSESAYNCLIEPKLGKIVRYQRRAERIRGRGVKLYYSTEKKKVDKGRKLLKRSAALERKKELARKARDPEYITDMERQAEVIRRVTERRL